VVFATTSSTTFTLSGFHGFPVVVLAAGALVLALWAILFAIRFVATFPKLPAAGPETSEPGPETPAVANLLVNRWKVSRPAMAATMLDLAARKMLEIDQLGSDHFVVRLKRPPEPGEVVTPYEQQVVDHVRARATGGSAPVEALAFDEPEEAQRWWSRFEKAVVKESRDRGLARNRWAADDWLVLGGTLLLALGLIGLAFALAHVIGSTSTSTSSSHRANRWDALLTAGFVWFAVMAWMGSLRAIRDTPQGQAAAAHWLGVRNYMRNAHAFEDAPAAAVILWDRLLAYGAGLGVAHDAVHQLPFEAEGPGSAWSRSTGTWRQLRIEYPHRFGYGEAPLHVFLGGLVRALWWGSLAFIILPVITRIALQGVSNGLPASQRRDELYFFAGILAAVSLLGLYLAVRFLNGVIRLIAGGRDLGKAVTIEGTVVKVHEGRAAIDDGKAEEIRAWMPLVGGPVLARGMSVRAIVSPHLHHVKQCTVLSAAPAAIAAEAATLSAGQAPIGTGPIDAAFVRQITGVSLEPVDPGTVAGTDMQFPAGSMIQAFADAANNRVVVGSMTLPGIASNMLVAAMSRSKGGSVQQLPGPGGAAVWVQDRILVVEHGDGIVSVDVEVAGLSVQQRLEAARALAARVLGVPDGVAPKSVPPRGG